MDTMNGYRFITLREQPDLKDTAAGWFSGKWNVPLAAYTECMDEFLSGKTEYGWYICLCKGIIVGGLGIIENDFHENKDLTPNVCAVYTEPEHRGRGIAGKLLDMAVDDMKSKGFSALYLVTDHTGLYERYGWEFLCMVKCAGGEMSRMYVYHTDRETRKIDSEIKLIPYYPNPDVALRWYQDKDVCKQVDNVDRVYTHELLNRMYSFLSTHGECYYIKYNGILVGDVTLRDNAEVCIVVCRKYQNRHIGRRCIADMIALAKEKGYKEVKANIYSFNIQSRKMFESAGFRQVEDEWFVYRLEQSATH